MADEKYCYPNSDVLINKLNIHDLDELHKAEREITNINLSELKQNAVKGNFDLKHLQSIHKAIFSDIYEWAGKIRTVDIAKGNLFCRAQFLDSYSQDIFNNLKRDNYLVGMNKEKAIGKLAEYMGDINALHPFREGNGRTQRQFITYLANATGLQLDMSKTDPDKMMDASLRSFNRDYSGFEKIFEEIAEPMSLHEQEEFLKGISKEAYKIFKNLKTQGLLPDREAEALLQTRTETARGKESLGDIYDKGEDHQKPTLENLTANATKECDLYNANLQNLSQQQTSSKIGPSELDEL